MPERLYTAYQVAELLGATPGEVHEWMQKGWLPFKRYPDGPVRVSQRGLLSFLRERGIDIEQIIAEAGHQDLQEPSNVEVQPAPEPPAAPVEPARLVGPEPADPAAQVAQAILADAVSSRATHVHLEPQPGSLALRLRIDGVIREKANFRRRLPRGLAPHLLARLKQWAGLEGTRPAPVRTGSFSRTVEGRAVKVALSATATSHGDRLVLRIRDPAQARPTLCELDLDDEDEQSFRGMLAERSGLIVLAGPRDIGRAKALLAMADELSGSGRSVVSLAESEDLEAEGISRAVTDESAGFGCAQAVRSLARQDADAIVVEELPDSASIRAGVEVAAGASLVLAGMSARSLLEALDLLMHAGCDSCTLASALLGVVEQRTIRKLCDRCKKQISPSGEQLRRLGLSPDEIGDAVFEAQGCRRCRGIGYRGTMGLFSIFPAIGDVARLTRQGADPKTVERKGRAGRTKTLRHAAAAKVRAGVTSLEEIARVLSWGDRDASGGKPPGGADEPERPQDPTDRPR